MSDRFNYRICEVCGTIIFYLDSIQDRCFKCSGNLRELTEEEYILIKKHPIFKDEHTHS